MSYINEALKRAQKEKDNRYGKLGYVAPLFSGETKQPWKRRIAVFAALLPVLAATLLMIEFVYSPATYVKRPAASQKKAPDVSAAKGIDPVKQGAASQEVSPKGASANSPSAKTDDGGDKKTEDRVDQLYQQAVLLQSKGDIQKARTGYLDVLKLNSSHVRALNNLGVVYLAMKNPDKALELFRRAAVLKRDYADPYYNMACLYAQKNDIDQSIWHLQMAASIDADIKKWVQKDPDFKNVMKSPKFREFVKTKFSPSTTEGN
jgi:tetratricopeptide (TPR) repeat protein